MRRTLYIKFILMYVLVALLGFLVTSTIGSHLVEEKLIEQESQQTYQEANTIASYSMIRYEAYSGNLDNIYSTVKAVATYQEATVWILNSQDDIIIDTDQEGPSTVPKRVEGFDPTTWNSGYYRTGDFYGYFNEPMLSVIAPITANMTVKGYVVIHTPMDMIYQRREAMLAQIHLIFFLFFALSLLVLLMFSIIVYHPLRKIIKGADEFAKGNLEYKIPVDTHDEMGYLAATLNYMSDELSGNNETQRQFIANVSHDFRSPLTSIKGYLEAIEDGTIPHEMQDKYIHIVLNETERLEKLTQGLLTLNNLDGKARMLNYRAFDINKIIKRTIATFEGTCRNKKISLELILTGEQLYVYADMEKIQQVLYNLIDNAIKFSPADASIVIETTEKNECIFVSVKDWGCGIPKENLPKIWERFYKIDASRGKDRKGTGLGLAIVKEIINSHNQNINVISTEGVGTEFIFTLERAKD